MTTATTEAPEAEKPKAKRAVKLEMPTATLAKALAKVMPAVQRRTTIPVLSSVLLRPASDDRSAGLELVATDLSSSIQVTIPASKAPSLAASFECFLLPGHKLSEYVKLLDSATLSLTPDEKTVTLRAGRSYTRFSTMPPSNFPDADFTEISGGLLLKQGVLGRMLAFTGFAVSRDESRYTLAGALLETGKGKLRMVATDGHRLALYEVPCDGLATTGRTLLPEGLLSALRGALDGGDEEVAITEMDDHIAVAIPQELPFALKHQKLTGQFPNYDAVLPKVFIATLTVNAQDFAAAITRCATCADERSGAIKLTLSPTGITLRASTAETGEAEEAVECVSDVEFEPFSTGVKDDYLLEPLRKLKGEVRIAIAKADGANALTFLAEPADGESFRYVVMPMRI